jgi:polar amino acid transport system permease protein
MSEVLEYKGLFWDGLQQTLLLTVLGIALTLVIAFVVGLMGISRHRVLRAPAYVFVEFFRGTSIIVQLFWVYYALPFVGIKIDSFPAAVLVLGLNEGAYAAEIVRSAIKSLPKGQTEAAIALGMRPTLRLRRILIPQAIPAMLPSFGNVFVDLLKATPLVSFIAVQDLTFNALGVRTETQETTIIFVGLLVVYFVLGLVLALITWLLEKRFAIDRRSHPLFRPLVGSGPGITGAAP